MSHPYKAPFVLGMDGGGTKTKVCAASMDGTILDQWTGGSLNVNSIGEAGVLQSMADIFQVLRQKGADWTQLKGLCLGAAGVSNPLTQQVLEQSVLAAGISIPPIIIGDHQAALYGAHGRGEGMIIIAGTGSICYGLTAGGQEGRAGGWGHIIDDEGSAYAIARDVLAQIVQAEDGRTEDTCMKQAVMEQLQIASIPELIQYIYAPATGKKEIAALAPCIMKGLEAGEAGAIQIIEKAAQNLAELVFAVAKRLSYSQGELAFCGSVITHNPALIQNLKKKIAAEYPDLHCALPERDAAAGAVLRCLEQIRKV